MDKGKFIELNNENASDFFTNFSMALYIGDVRIEKNYIILEVPKNQKITNRHNGYVSWDIEDYDSLEFETIYAEIPRFKFLFNSFIEDNLKKDIEELESNNKDERVIMKILIDTNPIFKDLEIKEFEDFENAIIKKFDVNSDSYNTEYTQYFRDYIFRMLKENYQSDAEENQRNNGKNANIDRFIKYGVLDEKDKVDLGYYVPINEQSILFLSEEGKISEEELYQIGEQKNIRENLIALSKFKRTSVSKIKNYMRFIPKEQRIELAIEGEIPYDYLKYADITKQDLIMYLNGNMGVSIIGNDRLPESLKITSDDILDYYGKADETGRTIITGTRLYLYVYSGFIESKKVIDVIEKNKILRITGEEDLFEEEEVSNYYSNPMLLKMFFTGEMDEEFVRKYKELLGENFEERSEEFITEMKTQIINDPEVDESKTENLCQQKMLEAYDVGICTANVLKQNLSIEYIAEQYTDENISEEYLLSLYESGVIDKEIIRQYFTDDELFNLYLEGKIQFDVIDLTDDKENMIDNLIQAIDDGKAPVDDMIRSYFNDTISLDKIDRLMVLVPDVAKDVDFLLYIDENTSFKKIKELFQNYLIDYNDINDLKDNKIITDEQFQELRKTVDKDKFMDKLEGKTFVLTTSQKSKSVPRREGVSKGKKNTDFDYERMLITEIFPDIDVDDLTQCGIIESYNASGRKTSLDGYRIFGSRETGLVIFAKFERENATFIMPFEQAAYFLKSSNDSDVVKADKIIVQERTKNKESLKRSSKAVRVIRHHNDFAWNFLNNCMDLSPEIKERYNIDEEYCQSVQEYIKAWETNHLRQKQQGKKDIID